MLDSAVVHLAGAEYHVRLESGNGGDVTAEVEGPRGTRRFRVQRLAAGFFLVDGVPIEARVGAGADTRRTLHARGEGWPLEVLSELEAALRRSGSGDAAARGGRSSVRSPMPGRVLAVEAREGASVRAGAPLFILEAMKMENEIRAPLAGVVRDLRVAAGDAVEGDQELCALEPDGSGDG